MASSVIPAVVEKKGGEVVTITGTFPTGEDLRVYLGQNGSPSDESCYSGTYGQGYACRSSNGTTLEIVTPPVDFTGQAKITVIGSTGALQFTVDVVEDSWSDAWYEMKTRYPDWHEVGNRALPLEEEQ
jgi:hypothetical protein